MGQMHSAEGTGPDPRKVCYPYPCKGQLGARGLESGVRSPKSLCLCLDLSETCFDLSETCLDFFVVLAQQGGWTTNLPPRLMKLVGRPQVGECSCAGMGHWHKKVAGAELLLRGQLGHREYWGKTNPFFLPSAKQVFHLPPLHPFIQIHLQ